MRIISLLSLVLVITACASQTSHQYTRSCYHQDKAIEKSLGVCQAVRVGDVLYISGIAGEGDISQATESAYRELAQVLQRHGLSFDNVVSERVYTTDVNQFVQNKGIRLAYYGKLLPASTWVEVEGFYQSAHVIELEATAVIPSSSRAFDIITYDSW